MDAMHNIVDVSDHFVIRQPFLGMEDESVQTVLNQSH